MLCFTAPNGFFQASRISLLMLAERAKTDTDRVLATLEQFVEAGKVKREGNVYWIVNTLKHRRLSGNNLKGALHEIETAYQTSAPRLVRECLKKYRGSDGVFVPENGVRTGFDNQNNQNKTSKAKQAVGVSADPPAADVSPSEYETKLLEVIESTPWVTGTQTVLLTQLRDIREDFATVKLLVELKNWRDYWTAKPQRQQPKVWTKSLRNWLAKAAAAAETGRSDTTAKPNTAAGGYVRRAPDWSSQ